MGGEEEEYIKEKMGGVDRYRELSEWAIYRGCMALCA